MIVFLFVLLNSYVEKNKCISSHTCSQKGQDQWVIGISSLPPYFVDLAANDPISDSNTVVLEKVMNWTGLCIEANPSYVSKLKQKRNCKVVQAAVSNTNDKNVVFVKNHVLGGILSSEFDNVEINNKETFKTTTRRLEDILVEANVPSKIGYLSLDVEGAEEAALPANFPFDRYVFSLITIERPPPLLNTRLFANGYLFVRNHNFDTFYIHNTHPHAHKIHKNDSFKQVAAKCTKNRKRITATHTFFGRCEYPGFPKETTVYEVDNT